MVEVLPGVGPWGQSTELPGDPDATSSLRATFSFLFSYLINQFPPFFPRCKSQPGNGFNSLNSFRENFASIPCFILALDLSQVILICWKSHTIFMSCVEEHISGTVEENASALRVPSDW